MWSYGKRVKNKKHGTHSCFSAALKTWLCLALMVPLVAGCASNQLGPQRRIVIDEEFERTRLLAEPDLSRFYNLSPDAQAALRNEIVTARMYIADMDYHVYEARLTREMQDEGLLATATSLGLTTSATLLTPPGTKTILSGIATAVTGLDKAYNEKVLLSNTMQALQTQMRADRKTQAGVIFAKMFKTAGNTRMLTPIAEYTLPMALSDADGYYQAGTLASALVGLSKTVANADRNADIAKSDAGPNPVSVSNVRETAAPRANTPTVNRPVIDGAVRVQSTFLSDNATTALRRFWKPNGVDIDPANEKVITDFLAEKSINVSIPFFLNSATFAAQRVELARRLRLIA